MLTERERRCLDMDDSGERLKDIAFEMGVSSTRARQIIDKAKHKLATPVKWPELSRWSFNRIEQMGYTTKQEVRDVILSGELHHKSGEPLYGKKTHAEICEWLGISG